MLQFAAPTASGASILKATRARPKSAKARVEISVESKNMESKRPALVLPARPSSAQPGVKLNPQQRSGSLANNGINSLHSNGTHRPQSASRLRPQSAHPTTRVRSTPMGGVVSPVTHTEARSGNTSVPPNIRCSSASRNRPMSAGRRRPGSVVFMETSIPAGSVR